MLRVKRLLVTVSTSITSLWIMGATALAADPPRVAYGSGDESTVQVITGALQKVATSIRDILGFTALLALIIAALIAHFVHDPRSKERARELVVVAIIGMAIAAFAPTLINWVEGLAAGINS